MNDNAFNCNKPQVQPFVLQQIQGEQWTSLNVEIAAFSDVIASKKEFATETISKELELLEARVDSFRKLWESATLYEVKDLTRDAVEVTSSKIKTLAKDFQSLREEADSISESCAEFGVDSPNLNEVHVIQADVDSVQERTQLLLGYVTELDELKNKKWLSFHSSLFELEDFCSKWSRLIQEQEEASSYSSITHQLQLLKLSLPALRHSRGDSFREDHWVELLQGKLGLPGSVRIHTLTFAHFVQSLDWLASPESCKFTKALQEKSQGEALARETLNEFIAWYQTFEIELFDHTLEERYTPLIQNWKEIFIAIGDKQNLLSALDSQQFTSFKDASDLHQLRLDRLETILRLLNDAQRKWLSLEPIYAKNSLPSEHSAFAKVDDHFRSLMENVKQNPKISNIVEAYSSQNDLVKLLRFCIAKLDNYQQALNSFLEDKRLLMPRLFFVGDDDLLEILGIQSTGNIFLIQRHLKSLFMGVDKINFHDGHIISFESSLGEVVELENGVFVTESTEVWLAELSAEHKHSMAVLLPRCSESTAGTMLPDFPSQILEVSEALNFSISVEKAIKNRDVILQLKDSYEKKILSLARCKSFENKLSQSKKNCIILDIMHYLEVIEYLAKSRVSSVDDWAWQKQLRYYNNGINCFVEMSGARFDYSFEYQGNQQKLVYTPLTDKCYLNLTQALRFGFGGNPFGPAGTGKTETVKALGASLGRHVLVFNCDEGINISSMGRMFIGIVSSGAWGKKNVQI